MDIEEEHKIRDRRKKLFLTPKEMNELRKLGLDTSDASFWWTVQVKDSRGEDIDKRDQKPFINTYPACPGVGFMVYEHTPVYSLQDILGKLPDHIIDNNGDSMICMILPEKNYVTIAYDKLHFEYDESWLKAAFKMLKWLLKNKFI